MPARSKSLSLLSAVLIGGAVATSALADGHAGNPAVKARKAHMQLYAFNLGILGNMVQGKADYNAETAAAAAADLASLSSMTQANYWPQGTDSEALPGETRALPIGWTEFQGAIDISMELAAASASMAEVAGNGLEALQGAFGPAAATCGACHKVYRGPRN